jgi:hypothetical protein
MNSKGARTGVNAVTTPGNGSGPWPWVLRIVLALAALAAPIVTFQAMTDPDDPDPARQQRLREVSAPRPGKARAPHTTADPSLDARP